MSSTGPMKKEISIIHTNHFLDCLREIKGEEGASLLLSKLIENPEFLVENEKTGKIVPVYLEYLKNPNNWVSNDFSLKTFEEAAKILGGSRPIYGMGRMLVKRKMGGARGPIIKLLLTSGPEILLKKMTKENRIINRTKDYKLISLEKNRAVVRLCYFPGVKFHKNICDYNLGSFTEVFRRVSSNSKVIETKCVQSGHSYCEFTITWESKNIYQRLLDITIRRYRILSEMRKELEAEHERSLDLVFNLEKRVKERTAELKKRNEEIEKAYKEIKHLSDAKSLFLADASHELRTPLAVFKGNIEMLKNLNLEKSESREVLDLVDDTTDRMTKLVSNLITLAAADYRKNSLNMTMVSLTDVMRKVCKQLENMAFSKNIELKNYIEQKINVIGNEDKLVEMIMNIVENAIKYTHCGGSVVVSLCKKDKEALVKISDTGIGIPKEYTSKIFDRFYRVDKSRSREVGGAGLGLSICKWITQVHQGKIGVESKEGKGSEFYVKLPALE